MTNSDVIQQCHVLLLDMQDWSASVDDVKQQIEYDEIADSDAHTALKRLKSERGPLLSRVNELLPRAKAVHLERPQVRARLKRVTALERWRRLIESEDMNITAHDVRRAAEDEIDAGATKTLQLLMGGEPGNESDRVKSMEPDPGPGDCLHLVSASSGLESQVLAVSKTWAQRPKPVVVDVETTGFGVHDRLVEIAVITLDPETWETRDEYDTLINPQRDVGPTGVHGVTAGMVELAPLFAEVLAPVAQRLCNAVLIAHNLAFDTRMMRYEFERLGVPIDFGDGICTLGATRAKLDQACEANGIRLTSAHRALADARATAELARRLGIRDRRDRVAPVRIEAIPPEGTVRTLRRDLADAGTSPMHRVVRRSQYPHGDEGITRYLDALDWVLDDGVIDRAEAAAMADLAKEWGISPGRQREAHAQYLRCMVEAAERDGFVSKAEHEILIRVAEQLGVDAKAVPGPDVRNAAIKPFPGMRICFTGQAMVGGRPLRRPDLEEVARENGWIPVRSVTKKKCDVLVAADPSTMSGKGRKARRYGKLVVSVAEFVDWAQ